MEQRNTRVVAAALLGVATLVAVLVIGLVVRSDDKATTTSGTYSGQVAIGDGRVLYLRCAGTGSPTVILEAGAHDSSDTWTVADSPAPPVFDEVAAFTHVCAYDRPGTVEYTDPPVLTTRSTPTAQPRSLDGMAADLDALLDAAQIPGPYVLVGHSLGGLVVHLFAQQHPDDTAGVVFVDTLAPELQQSLGDHWAAYAELVDHPGDALRDLYTDEWETIDLDGAVHAVTSGPAMPPVPTAVVSHGEPFPDVPGMDPAVISQLNDVWATAQDALVPAGSDAPHVVAAGSGHNVQQSAPDLTSAMIRLVLDRAAAPRPSG